MFQKKEDFQGDLDDEKEEETMTPKNKIPKRIRILMRKKRKLSRKILSSTSWRKNFNTMLELRKVEEEIDKSYKERRSSEEKEAIKL